MAKSLPSRDAQEERRCTPYEALGVFERAGRITRRQPPGCPRPFGEPVRAAFRRALSLSTLTGHLAEVGALQFAPDGSFLVSGADDASIHLWEPSPTHLD
ncbi:WD40 repeat domain-containing protein [Streptomyces chartreusis]